MPIETKGNHILAHMAVLSANLIYGANYSVAKEVMPAFIQPFGFILLRVLFTAIVFVLLAQFVTHEKVDFSDKKRFFLCALFGVAINQLLFFKGLDITTPINAALMMTTNPIMVLIAASLILKDRITWIRTLGIGLGITGASTLILWNGGGLKLSGSLTGDIMILINSLSFGVFLIMVKPMMAKYSTVTVMKWVFMFGTILVLPFGLGEFQDIKWSTFDTRIWLLTAFVVIGTTSLAYVFNTYALKKLSPSEVSVYIYLQPLFAVMFAVLLGKDNLKTVHFLSAALIFGGVYLASDKLSASKDK
ncbi:MAG: DMT family transporter [Bacteroidota bacterium]|jgi:drug/metabolite transporter (DMT)-like permease